MLSEKSMLIYCPPALHDSLSSLTSLVYPILGVDVDIWSSSETGDEAEMFKIQTFITLTEKVKNIYIPLFTLFDAPISPLSSQVERWPLLQAYALDELGGHGFFTRSHRVREMKGEAVDIGAVDVPYISHLLSTLPSVHLCLRSTLQSLCSSYDQLGSAADLALLAEYAEQAVSERVRKARFVHPSSPPPSSSLLPHGLPAVTWQQQVASEQQMREWYDRRSALCPYYPAPSQSLSLHTPLHLLLSYTCPQTRLVLMRTILLRSVALAQPIQTVPQMWQTVRPSLIMDDEPISSLSPISPLPPGQLDAQLLHALSCSLAKLCKASVECNGEEHTLISLNGIIAILLADLRPLQQANWLPLSYLSSLEAQSSQLSVDGPLDVQIHLLDGLGNRTAVQMNGYSQQLAGRLYSLAFLLRSIPSRERAGSNLGHVGYGDTILLASSNGEAQLFNLTACFPQTINITSPAQQQELALLYAMQLACARMQLLPILPPRALGSILYVSALAQLPPEFYALPPRPQQAPISIHRQSQAQIDHVDVVPLDTGCVVSSPFYAQHSSYFSPTPTSTTIPVLVPPMPTPILADVALCETGIMLSCALGTCVIEFGSHVLESYWCDGVNYWTQRREEGEADEEEEEEEEGGEENGDALFVMDLLPPSDADSSSTSPYSFLSTLLSPYHPAVLTVPTKRSAIARAWCTIALVLKRGSDVWRAVQNSILSSWTSSLRHLNIHHDPDAMVPDTVRDLYEAWMLERRGEEVEGVKDASRWLRGELNSSVSENNSGHHKLSSLRRADVHAANLMRCYQICKRPLRRAMHELCDLKDAPTTSSSPTPHPPLALEQFESDAEEQKAEASIRVFIMLCPPSAALPQVQKALRTAGLSTVYLYTPNFDAATVSNAASSLAVQLEQIDKLKENEVVCVVVVGYGSALHALHLLNLAQLHQSTLPPLHIQGICAALQAHELCALPAYMRNMLGCKGWLQAVLLISDRSEQDQSTRALALLKLLNPSIRVLSQQQAQIRPRDIVQLMQSRMWNEEGQRESRDESHIMTLPPSPSLRSICLSFPFSLCRAPLLAQLLKISLCNRRYSSAERRGEEWKNAVQRLSRSISAYSSSNEFARSVHQNFNDLTRALDKTGEQYTTQTMTCAFECVHVAVFARCVDARASECGHELRVSNGHVIFRPLSWWPTELASRKIKKEVGEEEEEEKEEKVESDVQSDDDPPAATPTLPDEPDLLSELPSVVHNFNTSNTIVMAWGEGINR